MIYVLGYSEREKRTLTATADEIIDNAIYQRKSGVAPMYSLWDSKTMKSITPKGWLVWSLWNGGAGMVYHDKTGYHIVTGLQSDFVYG